MPNAGDDTPSVRKIVDGQLFEALPEPLRQPVKAAVEAILAGNEMIRDALKEITTEERRDLLESLPRLAAESEAVAFSFVKRPQLSLEAAMTLLKRVNLNLIRRASLSVARELDLAAKKLQQSASSLSDFRGKHVLNVRGLRIVVAGAGDDVHEEYGAALIVDVGGDDIYRGRVGAGVFNCGALIDLGGNDQFDLDDLSGGAAVLGCGFLYDFGGHDRLFGCATEF